MEPNQGDAQHYPCPARHHHSNNSNSSPSLSEKRLLRRAFQGTPYPQSIAIPPPLSTSPPIVNTASIGTPSGANSIFSPRSNEKSFSTFFSPQIPSSATPRTPTSSLARRRRLSTASGTPPVSNSSIPATFGGIPSQGLLLSSQESVMAQQLHGQNSIHSDHYKTPGLNSSINGFDFTKHHSGPSSAVSGETRFHNEPASDEEQISQLLEMDLQMMEDESSDECLGNSNPEFRDRRGGLGTEDSPEDTLARIAQAMNLLSLQPPNGALQAQLGHFPSLPGGLTKPEPPWPPHPTPEYLLRESLRHSLDALKTLKVLDKAMVNGSVARERTSSRRHSMKNSENEGGPDAANAYQSFNGHMNGEISIVEVMKAYDQVAQGIRTAREVLSWAEHWIGEERDRARERLLKS